MPDPKQIVVVGAGIVGLSCAWRLCRAGASVTVVDSAPEADKCSFGNAGGIAVTEIVPASAPGLLWKVPGWLMHPLGPLSIRARHAVRFIPWLAAFLRAGTASGVLGSARALAALNALVYEDLEPLLAELGLASDLQRKGAIVVYSTATALDRERGEWQLRSQFGIPWQRLSPQELRQLEPALSPKFGAAVYLPSWSHVINPRRIVDRLRVLLQQQGGAVLTGNVTGFERTSGRATAALCEHRAPLRADTFVVAAGARSGVLARALGDRVLLESERGYNTTLPAPNVQLTREVIFAERKFVMTPLEEGIRIGGAAEFAGLAAAPNFARSAALLALGRDALPGLPNSGGRQWMGHRPATPDSLPVIGPAATAANVFYAFGHGHLGLTQAASTARLVEQLVSGRTTSIDLAPFCPRRFASRNRAPP